MKQLLERENHQQKDSPMEKDSEQLQIDEPRKLCCLYFINRTKYRYFYFIILLFIHIRRFRFRAIFCVVNRNSLLVSIFKSDTMTSSTALAVFGSVDEISNIVSPADLSAAVLNLFPWESLFVGDFLFLESRLIY